MKTAIVLTTIGKKEDTSIPEFEKTAKINNWDLIVVGDKLTPPMNLEYGTYLSPEDQLDLNYKSSSGLPWNCYARKNIGYLYALARGAEVVISTDDDNYPYKNYHKMVDGFYHDTNYILTGNGERVKLVNPINFFHDTEEVYWPRGLPMYYADQGKISKQRHKHASVGVVAGLWDGAPDFDAIGHMLYKDGCTFKDDIAIFKSLSRLAPYNTQNTAILRKLMPYQLLLPGLQRADDIWAGYISQMVMQLLEYGVLYISPTVRQKRNPHNLLKDLKAEQNMYLQTKKLFKVMDKVLSPEQATDYNAMLYYKLIIDTLTLKGILPIETSIHIDNWLKDIEDVL